MSTISICPEHDKCKLLNLSQNPKPVVYGVGSFLFGESTMNYILLGVILLAIWIPIFVGILIYAMSIGDYDETNSL